MPKSPFVARSFIADRDFVVALARAFGGAIVFGLPLFMTMEMWELGFTVPPERLAVFLLVGTGLLWPLAWIAGFRDDASVSDALIDAGVAYLVGVAAAAAVLALLSVLTFNISAHELTGKIAVQAVPAAMGALLARSQLGLQKEEEEGAAEGRRDSYAGELFLMATGALFLAFNVAPTEEIVLIAHQQDRPLDLVAVMVSSLVVMHGFVYAVEFRGQHDKAENRSGLAEFWCLTLPGYLIVLLVSLYVLWTFGRLDGLDVHTMLELVLVLAFPGAIGAASARLVL